MCCVVTHDSAHACVAEVVSKKRSLSIHTCSRLHNGQGSTLVAEFAHKVADFASQTSVGGLCGVGKDTS